METKITLLLKVGEVLRGSVAPNIQFSSSSFYRLNSLSFSWSCICNDSVYSSGLLCNSMWPLDSVWWNVRGSGIYYSEVMTSTGTACPLLHFPPFFRLKCRCESGESAQLWACGQAQHSRYINQGSGQEIETTPGIQCRRGPNTVN